MNHPALQKLLRQRLEIIADHPLRDRDPAAHLQALSSVSREILAYSEACSSSFDPKMRHYLANSSYQKALDHLAAIPAG